MPNQNLKGLLTPDQATIDAQSAYQKAARDESLRWNDLAQQRLQAAAQGSRSPWLGVQQWVQEIPLNMHLRGGPEANPEKIIADRENAFQLEKQRLLDLANQGQQPVPKNVWSGVR